MLFEEKYIYGPSDVCEISAVDSTGTPAGSLGSLSVPSSWGGGRSPSGGGPPGVGGDREIPGGGGAGDKVYPGIWTAPVLSFFIYEK